MDEFFSRILLDQEFHRFLFKLKRRERGRRGLAPTCTLPPAKIVYNEVEDFEKGAMLFKNIVLALLEEKIPKTVFKKLTL